MEFGRRKFLVSAGAATIALGSGRAWSQVLPVGTPPFGFPIVQLHTNDTSAQFRLLINPLRAHEFEATTTDGKALPLTIVSTTANPFEPREAIVHVLVEGLQPGRDYLLSAYDLGSGARVEERIFRALDTRPRVARVAIASCMMDVMEAFQDAMWNALEKSRPEVIFFLGDTCYTDLGGGDTVKGNWRRHFESRRTFNIFKWRRLVPIYATWDDHDFGGNNKDGTLPRKGDSLKSFRALWGWKPTGSTLLGHGVSTHVEMFGQRFFLADGRYYRDPKTVANATLWGANQFDWLMKNVDASSMPTWILNGTQFFGGYLRKDSFEADYPMELAKICQTLKDVSAPVILASGDVHFSEVMKIEKAKLGYETYEVTSSSILSTTNPIQDTKKVNPRRVTSTWHHNFIVVDSDPTKPNGIDFRTRSIGRGSKLYFDKSFSVRRV